MDVFELLQGNELLLLFVVIALGLLLGRVRVWSFSLGVAGVLFSGLLLTALRGPDAAPLVLSHTLRDFGLVVFVYAVGLTSGPGFFRMLGRRGLALNLAVVVALVIGASVAFVLGRRYGLSAGVIAGAFCGALTNTPALAAVSELGRGTPAAGESTLGYSVAYPFGIIGSLVLFQVLVRVRRQAFARELAAARDRHSHKVFVANFSITRPEVCGHTLAELRVQERSGLLISRLRHGDVTFVPDRDTPLHMGDVVTVVGHEQDIERGAAFFGERSSEHLEANREQIDMRRILVSRRALLGRSIGELELERRFGARVTRLRRADVDMIASDELRLELGDRLRVVAPRSHMAELGRFFGDSVRQAAEVDYLGVAIGIGLGLAVGMIPIPTPGATIRLGIAGGPLLVAIVLGSLGRSGPLLWVLPAEFSTSLRELGLLLFLAAVGTTAGTQLSAAASGAAALSTLVVGIGVTLVTNVVLIVLLLLVLRRGVIPSLGVASGMQTQPATLAAAYALSEEDEDVYVSYAVVYPIAMVGKILLAQAVFLLA